MSDELSDYVQELRSYRRTYRKRLEKALQRGDASEARKCTKEIERLSDVLLWACWDDVLDR